jgi:hypothetical protein
MQATWRDQTNEVVVFHTMWCRMAWWPNFYFFFLSLNDYHINHNYYSSSNSSQVVSCLYVYGCCCQIRLRGSTHLGSASLTYLDFGMIDWLDGGCDVRKGCFTWSHVFFEDCRSDWFLPKSKAKYYYILHVLFCSITSLLVLSSNDYYFSIRKLSYHWRFQPNRILPSRRPRCHLTMRCYISN